MKLLKKEYFWLFVIGTICFFVAYYNAIESQWKKSNFIFMASIMLCIIGELLWLFKSNFLKKDWYFQIFSLNAFIALFWDIAYISNATDKGNNTLALWGLLWFNLGAIISALYFFKTFKKKNKIQMKIVLIIGVFILLSIPILFSWIKGDSYFYFDAIKKAAQWDFSLNTFKKFNLCGHLSWGYTIYALIGEWLIPYSGIGIKIVNIILGAITIYAFWKILLYLNGDNYYSIIALIVFSLSPMFFGIIYEIHLDYPMLCFFVWSISSYIYKKQIWFILSSILLCFSKEPGILLYVGFVGGNYLFEILKNRKLPIKKLILIIMNRKIFISIAAFAFWIIYLIINRGFSWESSSGGAVLSSSGQLFNSFGVNSDYIVYKLKELYLFNGVWILILIIGVLCLFKVKKKNNFVMNSAVCGIYVAYIAFLIFSLLYITYDHYRYIIVHIVFLSLILAQMCSGLPIRRSIKIIMMMATFYLVGCNYLTYDPMTLANFRNVDIGRSTMVTTRYIGSNVEREILPNENVFNYTFSNGISYNRQILGFEKLFEKFLKAIQYKDDMLLVFQETYGNTTCYGLMGVKDYSNLYWNPKNSQMNYDETGLKLNIIQESEFENASQEKYSDIYYLKFPFGSQNEKIVINKESITGETINYNNWEMQFYKIK